MYRLSVHISKVEKWQYNRVHTEESWGVERLIFYSVSACRNQKSAIIGRIGKSSIVA